MISDFVKGKKKFDFSPAIQHGIMLHRAIDNFTDTHAATKEAKQFFQAAYRLYSGAFVDVVYDHFLANDSNQFPQQDSLMNCCQKAYTILETERKILPEKLAIMLPYMKKQNWLYNYQFNWGIEKSFEGLARRAVYLSESAIAFSIFEKNYIELQQCYTDFFPSLKKFAAQWIHENKTHK